jgi:serine/threonine-protein kinase
LARLFGSLSAFFLLAGVWHRFMFFHTGPLARLAPDRALFTHVGLLGFQTALWLVVRGRRLPEALLQWVDAVQTLCTLGAQAYLVIHIELGNAHQPHLLVVLAALVVLMCRAIIVPSRPRTTLVIGCLGVIPTLLVAARDGAVRGSAAEVVSFTAIWCAAAVALSTFISRVLYSLREFAAEAKLGRYVVERKLGEGGMGEVYLAHHASLRRPTAVKVLPPERAGVQAIARFEREVRATSQLSHPNTVAIYDFGRTREGIFYYAMEYLDGCDLQHLVNARGPLPPSQVVHVLAQIAGALAEAHAAGLVHRDLKPANVMLCERGGLRDVVKVLDFGLVKQAHHEVGLSAEKTEVNALIGTPAYMSPEAIRAPDTVHASADLYALGAIGYFLLTGSDVFQTDSVIEVCYSHLQQTPQRPSARVGYALPPDLEELILQCLEKLPEQRPHSAGDLRRALLACAIPVWNVDLAQPDQAPALAASVLPAVSYARVRERTLSQASIEGATLRCEKRDG